MSNMNKEELLVKLETVLKCNDLLPHDFIIAGSAASVLNGVANHCHDIDLYIEEDHWDNLVAHLGITDILTVPAQGTFLETEMFRLDGVEFYRIQPGNFKYRLHKLEGYETLCVFDILKYRIDLGRLKDTSDLHALQGMWVRLTPNYRKRLNAIIEKSKDEEEPNVLTLGQVHAGVRIVNLENYPASKERLLVAPRRVRNRNTIKHLSFHWKNFAISIDKTEPRDQNVLITEAPALGGNLMFVNVDLAVKFCHEMAFTLEQMWSDLEEK